jgi:esterase/lipase
MFLISLLIICLIIGYKRGPVPPTQKINIEVPEIPVSLLELDEYVKKDKMNPDLKPDNESRIIWADSIRETEYCLLYLPGFTATHMEGEPLHRNIAKKYGWNLYIPRVRKTGLKDKDAYQDLSIGDLLSSAEEAYRIADRLGKKVIIMSCSTGSTLSLYLASKHPKIAGLFMYSPNVKLATPFAPLMTGPWGLEIAKLAHGGKYRSYEQTEEYKKYWYTNYRVESVITLQQLIEELMTPQTFKSISCPVYVGYYYGSDGMKDDVVSIAAMKEMFKSINTPKELKKMESFDAGHHAMISKLTSKNLPEIEERLIQYIDSDFLKTTNHLDY